MTQTVPEQLNAADIAALDHAITGLTDGAQAWAALSLADRADLLLRTHASVAKQAARWAEAAIAAKGTPAHLGGEEWMSGPYVTLAHLTAAAHSLSQLASGLSPLDGITARPAPGGRVAFTVLPANMQERLLLHGFSAAIWMPPGVSADRARAQAGLGAKDVGVAGGVGLILGAGNISAIGPLDALYELIAFNRVSILKLNPTFASLLEIYQDAFAPLVEAGVLRIVNGAAAVGSYLAHHPDVVHVHITGSGLTHDAIVWGTGAEGAQRRSDDAPLLTKEITSELGGVSPIIVVPGSWSKADLRFQAEHVVTQRLHNGGHNCIAGQALILSKDWAQKDEFLGVLRDVLDTLAPRAPWYPGSGRKIALAEDSYPDAERHGGRLLIKVDETTSSDLYTTEYFAPVLGYTEIPGVGAEFFSSAVAFANDELDGTLGASIIVAPTDRKAMGDRFEDVLADLRYGTIGVNAWSAIGFLVPALPWGAYPGHTLDAVGSGIGVVHNSHLVDGPEKAVVTGPFRPAPRSVFSGELALSPKPAWFVTAKTGTATSEKLTAFAGDPGWSHFPGIFAAALRA